VAPGELDGTLKIAAVRQFLPINAAARSFGWSFGRLRM
jgi:hypothetical protein